MPKKFRFHGRVLPPGQKGSMRSLDINDFHEDHMKRMTLETLPINVDHDNLRGVQSVGKIVSSELDSEGWMTVVCEIDESTSAGKIAASKVRSGKLHSMSLEHSYMIDDTPTRKGLIERKKLVGVSLTCNPNRPGCQISKFEEPMSEPAPASVPEPETKADDRSMTDVELKTELAMYAEKQQAYEKNLKEIQAKNAKLETEAIDHRARLSASETVMKSQLDGALNELFHVFKSNAIQSASSSADDSADSVKDTEMADSMDTLKNELANIPKTPGEIASMQRFAEVTCANMRSEYESSGAAEMSRDVKRRKRTPLVQKPLALTNPRVASSSSSSSSSSAPSSSSSSTPSRSMNLSESDVVSLNLLRMFNQQKHLGNLTEH